MKMYVGLVTCCPLASHAECARHVLLKLYKKRDGQTDRQTDGQTNASVNIG